MIVWKKKEMKECMCRCAECGKSASEANLHKIEIGKIKFHLCYNCLKELQNEIVPVRPEGRSAFEICEDGRKEPEDAKDCLHCRECAICPISVDRWGFECLWKHFWFDEYSIPEAKPCMERK